MIGSVALMLTGSACNTPSANNAERRQAVTPFEQQQARQSYVDSQYNKFLKGGRTQDETAARALAGLEWDTHARRQSESRDATDRVRWANDTRAKNEQRAFERKLHDMGY